MKTPTFHPAINRLLAPCGMTPRHITAFDSSTVLQEGLAAHLSGKDYSVAIQTRLGRALTRAALCVLPGAAQAWLYQMGARVDAVPEASLEQFRSESVARWIVSRYPRKRYPVILLGATNGAATQLAAALGAPWLPQNHLMLVRSEGLDPDEPTRSLERGRRAARSLLDHEPNLQLHQMQDPVQDRLMSREALYFRLKRRTLGATYERFILNRLAPGGTLVIVDCTYRWPCIDVGRRHFFQLGGLGALSPADYYGATERGRAFLESQGARKTRWEIPAPDADRPEAEWGFAPELASDVLRFANRHGYDVERLSFQDPEHLSPWVADLYREHVVRDCGASDRLLIESFFLADPHCVHRTGSVPFWTAFNAKASAQAVERYLDAVEPFDDIRAVLFSNGVRAPDTATAADWRAILARARKARGLLGVRLEDFPADFAVYFRYHEAISRLADAPRAPTQLNWSTVQTFARDGGAAHPVSIEPLWD